MSDDLQPLTIPVLEPMLGREMAGEFDVDRYWFKDQEDPHPSEVLRKRSEPHHRLGELYTDMFTKDADLYGFESKVIDAVLGLQRFIVPANDTPIAKEIAHNVRLAIAQVNDFESNLRHQLRSESFGVAFDELIWGEHTRGPIQGMVSPVDILDRPMYRFAFVRGAVHVRRALGKLEPAPAGKFLVMSHGTKDSKWGDPKADKVYWPWFIKRQGWKFYALAVERFAAPTMVGKYPFRQESPDGKTSAVNEKTRGELLRVLESYQSNNAIAIPNTIDVALLEAMRSGSMSYPEFIEMCSRSEALVYNGEISTSGLRPGTGAFASDKVAAGQQFDKVIGRAHTLCAHLGDTLLRWITEVNYGPDAPVPSFEIDTSDLADVQSRREGVKLLSEYELPIATRQVYRAAGFDQPRSGEDVILLKKPVAPAAPPFAAGPPPPAVDDASDEKDEDDKDLAAAPSIALAAGDAETKRSLREAKQRDLQIEEAAALQRSAVLAVFAEQQRLVLEAWEAGEREGLLAAVASRLDPRPLADAIQVAQIYGVGLACQHVLDDGIPLGAIARPRRVGGPRPDIQALAALPNEAGAAAATVRTAVDYWQRLLGLAGDLFASLFGGSVQRANAVAGATYGSMLVQLHQLIAQAVSDGTTREGFREQLARLYEQQGLHATSDWHADLILANGTRTAYGLARYEQLVLNPAAHRIVPYLAWRTLDDDVVRERRRHNHRIVHDVVFAIGHEFWKTWWFPAGHNCRCYVATISKPAARRLGYTGAEPTGPWPTTEEGRALPDPGFYTPIDLASDALRAEDQVDSLIANATAIGSSALLEALSSALATLNLRGAP